VLFRSETPARLRRWAWSAALTSVALLVSLSLLTATVREQVRVIGDVAVPRAATAAELYFALSDLDAQVARMVLSAGDDALAGSRIDALGTYDERGRQIDEDLQRLVATADAGAGRDTALRLLHGLAVYRQWVWQALTAGPATGALGYYTQATNVLHLQLLPAAQELRDAAEDRLAETYAAKQRTTVLTVIAAAVLGAALLVLLVGLQVFLARRFRRVVNPALAAATLLVAALLTATGVVLDAQERRLENARGESLLPYLALARARAVSYDAAADTGRFLLSADRGHYRDDFTRKAGPLTDGRGLTGIPGSGEAAMRWLAYRRVHERIVALADSGRREEAVAAYTGIRRGEAAFDFYAYDVAISRAADERKRTFDVALRDTTTLLRGWAVAPVAVPGLVILLVAAGVRRRLAEYR